MEAKFLPLLKKPNDFMLIWKGDEYANGRLISSEESYLEKEKYTAGSSYPIIDEQSEFQQISSECKKMARLGLIDKRVPIEALINQIFQIMQLVEEKTEVKSEVIRGRIQQSIEFIE